MILNKCCRDMAKMETIDATMSKKTEKEKYSFFLFSMGEAGREIFNTCVWPKGRGEDGQPTGEDDITIAALFKKLEDYCKPQRNLIVERHRETKPE